MSLTSVLIIDDQPLFRQGVRCTLEQHANDKHAAGVADELIEHGTLSLGCQPSALNSWLLVRV